ncbi:unnamed protein product, partial [Prorocentrum cordatum]
AAPWAGAGPARPHPRARAAWRPARRGVSRAFGAGGRVPADRPEGRRPGRQGWLCGRGGQGVGGPGPRGEAARRPVRRLPPGPDGAGARRRSGRGPAAVRRAARRPGRRGG